MINNRMLKQFADQQHGYFTSQQAIEAGFNRRCHVYHAGCGNWERVDRGLFRLPGYPDTLESEFVKWSLWVIGCNKGRSVVISHESALFYHRMGGHRSANVHLTIPLKQQHKTEKEGCVFHRDNLLESDFLLRQGFCVTTPLKTLNDMKPDLILANQWLDTVKLSMENNLLEKEEARELLGDQSYQRAVDINPSWAASLAQRGFQPAGFSPGYLPDTKRNKSSGRWSTGMDDICRNVRMDGSDKDVHREWRLPKQSFTLVEMLVVVAIIGILAGMLLPSLQRALGTARNLQCQNTIKQVALGFTFYADSNNDCVPWAWTDLLTPKVWYSYIYPCIAEGVDINSSSNWDNYGYYCPAAEKGQKMFTTYAMNGYAGGVDSSTGLNFTTIRFMKLQKVSTPTITPIMGEKEPNDIFTGYRFLNYMFPPALQYQNSPTNHIALRHNMGSNWVFFDNHVEWREGLRAWSGKEIGIYLKNAY